jgi:uncharacterized protein
LAAQRERVLPAAVLSDRSWPSLRLIIFTRYPEPGRVKTRLIPALGADGAQRLHREMAEHTLKQLSAFQGEVVIYFEGGSREKMEQWLGEERLYRSQAGDTLGERLQRAFQDALSEGKKKVVAIGTDCPQLALEHVEKSFLMLEDAGLALGPALDGGYYLVGLSGPCGDLFDDIPWGSDRVFKATLEKARLLGMKTAVLETLADVDNREDLPVWFNRPGKG